LAHGIVGVLECPGDDHLAHAVEHFLENLDPRAALAE
jgi:hypothetical protein